jgi:transposase
MIKIDFSQEEQDQLDYERYHYPHPKIQKRFEVLYLKSQGVKHKEICRLCSISKTTLTAYLKNYIQGGIESLKQMNYKGNPSQLNAYEVPQEKYLRENPPRCTAEAQSAIENLTGIKRSPTQIREFMIRYGMKIRKVGFVPGKIVEPERQIEQAEFLKKRLQPRLEEAKTQKRTVFFVDAAHFVHGAFLGFVWCFIRLFIPSPSGRKRFNVLGALNAVTKEIITINNETYINSETVCQLFLFRAETVREGLITVVLDNARYQKCALVQQYAQTLGIELLYLPPYSPNLNLVERFWRFVKKECLYSKYYDNFNLFKSAISNCIDNPTQKQTEKLKSLLSWNFQSFSKVQISTV